MPKKIKIKKTAKILPKTETIYAVLGVNLYAVNAMGIEALNSPIGSLPK